MTAGATPETSPSSLARLRAAVRTRWATALVPVAAFVALLAWVFASQLSKLAESLDPVVVFGGSAQLLAKSRDARIDPGHVRIGKADPAQMDAVEALRTPLQVEQVDHAAHPMNSTPGGSSQGAGAHDGDAPSSRSVAMRRASAIMSTSCLPRMRMHAGFPTNWLMFDARVPSSISTSRSSSTRLPAGSI